MKKIYGNEYLLKTLSNMITSGKTAHSVIIHGEKGTGKKLIADYYTQQLLCNNPIDGKACGECVSCRNVENHMHPDVTYVGTEGKLEGYSVSTARKIITDAFVKPNNNTGRKIYIFRDCRNMSVQTQNVLLKIIEEPPDYAYFIFTAESKYEFLSTIISRCICLAVSQCTEQETISALAELSYSESDIQKAVECFHGNIGACIDYISDEKIHKRIDLTKSIADSIIRGNEYELNRAFYSVGTERNELYDVFAVLDKFFRDCAVLSVNKNAETIGCFREQALRLSGIIPPYKAVRIHNIIEESCKAVQLNVNALLAVTSLCAEIMKIIY